jgi:gliding motility-associated-like protein
MLTGTGCLGRDTFVLGNYPLPVLDLGNDTIICPGNGFTLDADPNGLNPGATYTWSPASSNQTISVPGQGTYAVTVTSTDGCVSNDTLVVIESNAIAVNLGADTSICAGASLTLDAGTASSYQWSNSQTTQTISVTTSGTYSVTVSFGVNCTTADTITLAIDALPVVNLGNDTLYCPSTGLTLNAGNPGSTYVWSPPASTQQITLSGGGTFAVTVTNAAGCVATDNIVVQGGTEPQVSLGPDISICPGTTATLDAGAGNTSYLWNTNATTQSITVGTAGLYYVLGTTSCGTDSAAINVAIAPAPFANAGLDATICAGDSLLLAGASAGGNNIFWTASSGSFDSPFSTTPTYISDTSASGPVDLVLTVIDSCGTVFDTVTITVLPRVQVTILLPDTVCYQRQVEIFFNAVGDVTSFQWIGNGSFADTTSNPTIFIPAPGAAGHFDIQLQTTGQCGPRVFNTSFYAEDTVIANFSWSPATIYPGTWVNFDNQTYLPTLPAHWSFGDGFFSTDHDPEHRFYLPGTYNVELISLGAGGCLDTATLALTVLQPDTLIPNVFSPNGDGINDFFDVLVPPTTAYSLAIFDRWGRRVFLSNNPDQKWNGKLNDADLPDGVYYYVIEMTLLSQGILRYNGPVTLLR